uniref:Uncharacterized protein n=1 Tax=Cacopsylla melanoneura TaxID=428564 RepID=A0A8D8UNH6_9HEMI
MSFVSVRFVSREGIVVLNSVVCRTVCHRSCPSRIVSTVRHCQSSLKSQQSSYKSQPIRQFSFGKSSSRCLSTPSCGVSFGSVSKQSLDQRRTMVWPSGDNAYVDPLEVDGYVPKLALFFLTFLATLVYNSDTIPSIPRIFKNFKY